MPLLKFALNLHSLGEEERNSIYALLEHESETGLCPTGKQDEFVLFLDADTFSRLATQLPSGLLYRIL